MCVRAVMLSCVVALAAAPAVHAQAVAHPQAASPARTQALGELSKSLQDLAEKVSPSVVQIFVTGYAPPEEQNERATGEPVLERSAAGVGVYH